jgi:hypothetical protein
VYLGDERPEIFRESDVLGRGAPRRRFTFTCAGENLIEDFVAELGVRIGHSSGGMDWRHRSIEAAPQRCQYPRRRADAKEQITARSQIDQ